MRQILVDFARDRQAAKRGSGVQHVPLAERHIAQEVGRDLVALDDALGMLARIDERKSKVVELRFFGGLSTEEVAQALGVSTKTVLRDGSLPQCGSSASSMVTQLRPPRSGDERSVLLNSRAVGKGPGDLRTSPGSAP